MYDGFCPLDGVYARSWLDHSLITFEADGNPIIPGFKPRLHSLRWETVPKFSMKNDNYRGRIPDELRDLTWLEERVCARYGRTRYGTRLSQRNGSDLESLPFMLYGSSCAFEMNAVRSRGAPPSSRGHGR